MVLFIFDWKTSSAFFFFSGSRPLLSSSSYQMELLCPVSRVWLGDVLLLLCLLLSSCGPSSASLL